MDTIVSFFAENFMDILLALVGLSAFGVYFWQKHDQTRVAATLVKGEIDSIEKSISVLRDDNQLGDISVYHSKKILGENLWNKYKHLLIKRLSKSEAETIERFFDNAEQIEHARADIYNSMRNGWTTKSYVEQYITALIVNETSNPSEIQEKITKFQSKYQEVPVNTTPQIAVDALIKHLNNFNMLSGTTGYNKIQNLSYDK